MAEQNYIMAWENHVDPPMLQREDGSYFLLGHGDVVALRREVLRRERCAGSGDKAYGHGHLCPCGRIFVAPVDAGGCWSIPEHDGECSW